jgi:hypothetical protein
MDTETLVLAGLVAGTVCGLVPLVVGIVKNRVALGLGGLAACMVAGLALGLILAIPVAALFVYLIYRSARERPTAST